MPRLRSAMTRHHTPLAPRRSDDSPHQNVILDLALRQITSA
jgi:hypothetical protein